MKCCEWWMHYHTNQEHGEVCPAGWQKGKDAMAESPEGVSSYLSSHSESL